MMTVVSMKAAQKRNSPHAARNHARGRAYVALLRAGPRGSVDRDFIAHRTNGTETQLLFEVAHQPGDIYEVRRWFWDDHRETFMGGVVHVGFDGANRPFMLTRDEAFASVLARSITTDAPADFTPAVQRPKRMLPADLRFR